jgi:hypothetical protein
MTAKRLPPEGLPNWPRWLTAELAAAYVGVGLNKFREEITAGVWPAKNPKLGRWDRAALDQASDRLSNPSYGATERLLGRLRGEKDANAVSA